MKRTLQVVAIAMTQLVLMGSISAAEEAVDFRVAVFNGPSGVAAVNLMERGPDAVPGLSLSWEVLPSPKFLLPRLLKGDFEAAMLPSNMGSILYAKKQPYLLGAVTGDGLLYVVGTDVGIEDWKDLEGRTLYLSGKGATPDYLARYLLEESGLEPGRNVTLDFRYGHADLAKALLGGLVDIALLPEPFATLTTSRDPGLKRILDLQETWLDRVGSDYPITVLVISSKVAEAHPERVAVFLDAFEASLDRAVSDPSGTASLVPGNGFTLDVETVEAAIPRLNLVWRDPAEARGGLEDFFGILATFDPGSVGGGLPGNDWYALAE